MADWAYDNALDEDPEILSSAENVGSFKGLQRWTAAIHETGYMESATQLKRKFGPQVLSRGWLELDRETVGDEEEAVYDNDDEDLWLLTADDDEEAEGVVPEADQGDPEDALATSMWEHEPNQAVTNGELLGFSDSQETNLNAAYRLFVRGRNTPACDKAHQWMLKDNPSIFESEGIKLFPHQRNEAGRMLEICASTQSDDVNALESLPGAFIAYQMGTGKTYIIITVMRYLIMRKPKVLMLLVVPLGLLSMWNTELIRFLGSACVLMYRPQLHGQMHLDEMMKYNIVLTTFETVRNEWSGYMEVLLAREALVNGTWMRPLPPRDSFPLMLLDFFVLFVDEVAKISRFESKLSQAMCSLRAEKRFGFTGTPIENDYSEIQTLMKFLRIKPWDERDYFGDYFVHKGRGKIRAKKLNEKRNSILNITLRALVIPLNITDTFDGKPVVDFRPVRTKLIEHYLNDQEQVALARLNMEAYWNKELKLAGFKPGRDRFFARLLECRMKCFHIACGESQYGDQGISDAVGEYEMEAGNPPPSAKTARMNFIAKYPDPTSSRLEKLLEHLVSLLTGDQGKVLVFDQFLQTLDLIANALDRRNISYLRYDGWQNTTQRDKAVNDFQDPENSVKIMLITIATGGVGLNLTAARSVFIMTMGWNPFADQQAESRANRTKQTGLVTVYYFYSHNTIERRIWKIRAKKTAKAQGLLAHGAVSDVDVSRMMAWDFEEFQYQVTRIGRVLLKDEKW